VARLSRLAYRLVWVNPQRGKPGYAPLAAGMAACLRTWDAFVSGAFPVGRPSTSW